MKLIISISVSIIMLGMSSSAIIFLCDKSYVSYIEYVVYALALTSTLLPKNCLSLLNKNIILLFFISSFIIVIPTLNIS